MARPTKGRGGKAAAASASAPLARLQKALLSLAATRSGFEGLTAALIDAASKGSVRLMSSGDQQGVDAIGPGSRDGARRAMQSKRYKADTGLDLNGLLGEMTRADDHFKTIDCWILATTKSVRGKEAEALEKHAEALGWKLIVLDWTEDGQAIPRLALLCAAFPDVTIGCAGLAGVGSDLAAVGAIPGFAGACDALVAELRAADAGFEAARATAATRLHRIFEDAAIARSIAGASPALLAKAPPVSRPAVRKLVRDWAASDARVLALLGGEGNGKTWAALQGIEDLQSESYAPIALLLSSGRAAAAPDALSALVAELTELGRFARLRLRDPDSFWRRRLDIWGLPGDGAAPRIILLVDGLDELDGRDWDEWMAPLLVPEVASLVRLVVTCREDDWDRRIALRDLDSGLLDIQLVGRFEPGERDTFLASRGVDPAMLSSEVLSEALHPRTAFHVTRLAAELPDLKRLTREQLLLRDFLNRSEIRRGPLQPEEFQVLVARLARDAQQAALSQAAFATSDAVVVGTAATLSGRSGSEMRRVLSDLVSSRWFTRADAGDARIEFTDAALPDAVGLALAADLKRLSSDAAGREIDRFLEPWGADDLVEGVLRMTATALVTDGAVVDSVCDVVLERWFARPFHGRPGQDFWRRLHIVRPSLFLDFAERVDSYRHPWLTEWAIACLWEDHESAKPLVEERIAAWLGGLALPSEQQGADPAFLKILNSPRNRQLRRAQILGAKGEAALASRLTAESDGRDLVALAARVIGFLPRKPFMGAITGWAANVAASARTGVDEAMAVLIRENGEDHDAAVAMIRAIATECFASRSRLTCRVGAVLLDLTGLPEDSALAAPWRRSAPEGATRSQLILNPGGTLESSFDFKGRPELLVRSLALYASRSTVQLSSDLSQALARSTRSLRPSSAPEWLQNEFAQLTVLARWEGPQLLGLIEDFLATSPGNTPADRHERDDYRRVGLTALPVLDDAARERLASALIALVEPNGEGEEAGLLVAMARQPLDRQIEILLAHPVDHWPAERLQLFAPATPADLLALLVRIDGEKTPARLRPLVLLATELARSTDMSKPAPIDWSRLFGSGDADLVRATIALGLRLDGAKAAMAFADAGITIASLESGERFYASELLAFLDDEALAPHLSDLETESLLRLFGQRPGLRTQVNPLLMTWVRNALATKRKSWNLSGLHYEYPQRQDYFDQFLAANRTDIENMLRIAWADKELRSNIRHDHGEGPAWPLLASLLAIDPVFARDVWNETVSGSVNMWIGMIEHWPAALPAGTDADAMRRTMLARPKTDDKLFHAIRQLQQAGHVDLVVEEVDQLSTSSRAVDRARAFAIAGFMQPGSAADALWQRLAAMPTSLWLQDVRSAAIRWRQDAIDARAWAAKSINEVNELAAWAAALAMLRVYDGRCPYLYREDGFKIDPDSWRANWLDLLVPTRRALRERRLKELDKSKNLAPRTDRIVHQDS